MTQRTIFLTLGFLSLAAFIALPLSSGDPKQTSTLEVVVSAVAMCLFIASWITAVYAWTQRPRGPLHVVALVFLVPLGFLWGWAYLLAVAATSAPSTHQGV